MNSFRYVVILGLSILLFGCNQAIQQKPAQVKRVNVVKTPVAAQEYAIGIDDNLRVEVWRNPDLSVVVPVRPDGRISTPLVGDVKAAGLTPSQLANSLENKLSKFIREPHVSVIVTGLNSKEYEFRVRVTGAVRKPISIPYRKGMTVLDLVLAAGGTNEFASPNRTKLHRKTRTGVKSMGIRLGEILNNGQLQSNFDLMPGDIVTVPERVF